MSTQNKKIGLYEIAKREGYIIGRGPNVLFNTDKKSIFLEINGKKRIIRKGQISYQTEDDIECTYAGFNIEVMAQETGGFYIQVHNPEISLGTAVDGYFGEWSRERPVRTIEDALVLALENILPE